MRRRKWDAHTNAMIVIEGLQGKPVAALGTEHQISQSLYDQWRDQLLAQAAQAFDDPQRTRQEARRQQENARLRQLVGELTFEFKQSDGLLA
jgi:transposase-like protein